MHVHDLFDPIFLLKQLKIQKNLPFTCSHLDNISFIDNNCKQGKMELELGSRLTSQSGTCHLTSFPPTHTKAENQQI